MKQIKMQFSSERSGFDQQAFEGSSDLSGMSHSVSSNHQSLLKLVKAQATGQEEKSIDAYVCRNPIKVNKVNSDGSESSQTQSNANSGQQSSSEGSQSSGQDSDDSDEVIFNKSGVNAIHFCKMEPEDKRQYLEECYDEYNQVIKTISINQLSQSNDSKILTNRQTTFSNPKAFLEKESKKRKRWILPDSYQTSNQQVCQH